jgi:hypothetical protein
MIGNLKKMNKTLTTTNNTTNNNQDRFVLAINIESIFTENMKGNS